MLREMRSSQEKLASNLAKDQAVKDAFTRKFSIDLVLEIWKACKDGDLDTVRILIREGQDVNEQTQSYRNTPLHIAAQNGHLLVVKFLLN